jgi:hypothetical protein
MSFVLAIFAELLKDALPQLLEFFWEKAHEPATTAEDAADDPVRRERLLAAIHQQHQSSVVDDGGGMRSPSSDGTDHAATATR